MADPIAKTHSAKLPADYWITLTRSDEPEEWTVRLLGPAPFFATIKAATEDAARTAAVELATQYFQDNEIEAAIPESLRWTAATKMSFKVPV